MKVIFCRIGWMSDYNGPGDIFLGKMIWKGMEAGGGEMWNFAPEIDGRIYGYVMLAQGKGTINIDKLGAKSDDDFIEGVTVIFYAKNKSDNKNYIIGWHENATVLRNWRDLDVDYQWDTRQFSFIVSADRAWLIPADARSIEVRTHVKDSEEGRKYPGEANVFFGSGNPEFTKEVLRGLEKVKQQIETGVLRVPEKPQKQSKFCADPRQRKLIEDRSVELAKFHLSTMSGVQHITNVGHLCLGWDIELFRNSTKYRVEVKGTSSLDWSFLMTNNEYKQQWYQDNYLIIIVANILSMHGSPMKLRVCSYDSEDDCFVSQKEFYYITHDNNFERFENSDSKSIMILHQKQRKLIYYDCLLINPE